MVRISPSILAADFSKLGDQIKELEKFGADMIHIDVMDGMFVPNISIGLPVIKSIKNITKLPFDVHLMIEDPSRFIKDFAEAGADIITVHYEADKHIDRTIEYIKSFGIKASIALNPGTPVICLKNLISVVDMVLIMTVNPGFGGQKFIPYSYDKISELKALSTFKEDFMIEVDGGIDANNIKNVISGGANIIVAGSSIFKNNDIEHNLMMLRKGIE
jgi:ribulose-phosphate 3-epimerase